MKVARSGASGHIGSRLLVELTQRGHDTHEGESHISTEDHAVALVDALEKPARSRQRFTVGY